MNMKANILQALCRSAWKNFVDVVTWNAGDNIQSALQKIKNEYGLKADNFNSNNSVDWLVIAAALSNARGDSLVPSSDGDGSSAV